MLTHIALPPSYISSYFVLKYTTKNFLFPLYPTLSAVQYKARPADRNSKDSSNKQLKRAQTAVKATLCTQLCAIPILHTSRGRIWYSSSTVMQQQQATSPWQKPASSSVLDRLPQSNWNKRNCWNRPYSIPGNGAMHPKRQNLWTKGERRLAHDSQIYTKQAKKSSS